MEIIPEKSRKLLGSFAKMTPRQIRKWATLGWASYGRFVQMNANDKPAGRKQYLGFVLKNVFGEEKPQIVADIEPFYREILSVYPDWESMSVQTQNEYLFAGTGFLCWQNLPCPKCNKDLLAEAKEFFFVGRTWHICERNKVGRTFDGNKRYSKQGLRYLLRTPSL